MTNHQVLNSNQNKQSRFFYGYTVVLASFLILVTVWGALYTFGVFFKPVLAEFGWTRAATSGAYSLNVVLIGFFSIFAGRLSDRFGPRRLVTVCGLFVGLGYMLMSQISAVWQMYLSYGVLVSLGLAGIWVPLMSTVARWFTKRRGLVSGIVVSGVGVGTIIMPLLANQLISSYNWRISYVIVGLLVLVVTVIAAQFLRRDPNQRSLLAHDANAVSAASPDLQVQGFSLQEAIRAKPFWVICIMCICAGFCFQIVMVHIVPYATDMGISSTAAASILSAIGGISIMGRIGLGSIGDRLGNKLATIIIFFLTLFGFLWLQFTSELWMLYLFAAIFALGYGGFIAVQSPLIADFFGLRSHGAIYGLAMFANNIGGATGNIVAGRIFDVSGSYYRAFILCAILGAIGLILSKSLKAGSK